MKLWLDNHLAPALCPWLEQTFSVEAIAVRTLGFSTADDPEIFAAAREAGAILVTKDADFAAIQERLGAPPQILWLTFGNTSNDVLRQIFAAKLRGALNLLDAGERLVEISGPS